MRLRDSSFAKWSNYFCFPCLMTISLGVKSIFNKFPKNIMTYLLVNILLGNKTKKSGQTNSKMINVRLCRTISKYLRSIKIQGKQTADGSKQIDSWAILRKGVDQARKSAWPTARELLCYRYIHSIFSFYKNVVFPAQAGIFLVSCQF